MKERPILFSGPMVNAILEGRKTQTRRVITNVPVGVTDVTHNNAKDIWFWWNGRLAGEVINRYGKPGDRLWVRETWRPESDFYEGMSLDDGPDNVSTAFDIRYATDPTQQYWHTVPKDERKKYTRAFERLIDGQSKRWHPSIHMPRWASRITLEITNVRVERLYDISEGDAKAEGVEQAENGSYRTGFYYLWDKINGKKHPWSSNPWVWVVEFKKL